MRHPRIQEWMKTILALAMLSALAAGCASHPHQEGVIEGLWAPKDWTGGKVGAKPARWEHVGSVEVLRDTEPDLEREVGQQPPGDGGEGENGLGGPSEEGPLFPEGTEEIVFAAVDVRRGERYRVRVAVEDLERLHREAIRSGAIHASREEGDLKIDERRLEGPAKPTPGSPTARRRPARGTVLHAALDGRRPSPFPVLPATWSNNTDTRIRRAIADGFSSNHVAYRRIGQLNNACSGTLIGPRHVLTSAHCLVNNTTQAVFWSVFRPRRNGENTTPWGARDPEWYWFPEEYWDGTCTSSGACNRYDIALVILAPWSGAHPGWMGYWYAPGGTLETWNIYKRGYPRADPSDDSCFTYPSMPVPCTPWMLYGDTELCDLGTFSSPDGSGWNREISVDCDGQRGMSGSAYYTYNAHPSGPVTLGQYSQYGCTPPNCNGVTFPNTMTRITPQYASIITWWRNFCPTTQAQCF